jgi:hypothetical protein
MRILDSPRMGRFNEKYPMLFVAAPILGVEAKDKLAPSSGSLVEASYTKPEYVICCASKLKENKKGIKKYFILSP